MSGKGRRFFHNFWGTFSYTILFILRIPGPVEMVMESMHRVIGRLTAKTNKTRLTLFPASEKNILSMNYCFSFHAISFYLEVLLLISWEVLKMRTVKLFTTCITLRRSSSFSPCWFSRQNHSWLWQFFTILFIKTNVYTKFISICKRISLLNSIFGLIDYSCVFHEILLWNLFHA